MCQQISCFGYLGSCCSYLVQYCAFRLYNKKEASVHDPFAELTGLKVEPPKASPPLKKLPGSSALADRPATAPSPSTKHGGL